MRECREAGRRMDGKLSINNQERKIWLLATQSRQPQNRGFLRSPQSMRCGDTFCILCLFILKMPYAIEALLASLILPLRVDWSLSLLWYPSKKQFYQGLEQYLVRHSSGFLQVEKRSEAIPTHFRVYLGNNWVFWNQASMKEQARYSEGLFPKFWALYFGEGLPVFNRWMPGAKVEQGEHPPSVSNCLVLYELVHTLPSLCSAAWKVHGPRGKGDTQGSTHILTKKTHRPFTSGTGKTHQHPSLPTIVLAVIHKLNSGWWTESGL